MIVFDTETTGLPRAEGSSLNDQPRIIEFAGVKLNDDTLEEVGSFEFLAHPGHKLSDEIIKITGITDDLLKDAKPFGANFNNLAEFFVGERIMLAHNVDFDRKLLTYELQRLNAMNKFPWPPKHMCSIEAAYSIQGRKLKLGVLHELATGAPHADAHRAMPDVRALVTVVRWLRGQGRL